MAGKVAVEDQCRCKHGRGYSCVAEAVDGTGLCAECLEFELYRGEVEHQVYLSDRLHRTITDRSRCGA